MRDHQIGAAAREKARRDSLNDVSMEQALIDALEKGERRSDGMLAVDLPPSRVRYYRGGKLVPPGEGDFLSDLLDEFEEESQ